MIWSSVLDWSQQSLASLCEDFLGPCDIRVSYQRVAGKFLCSSIEMQMEVTGTYPHMDVRASVWDVWTDSYRAPKYEREIRS